MSSVTISPLGISAARIENGDATLYVDAFADHAPPFEAHRADLILVTHDDGDHFLPNLAARAAQQTGATIVGPPSIAYPLLAEEGFPAERLEILYPIHLTKPIDQEVRGVRLRVYQTTHFNDWHPVHVSYLIEMGGKRIYATGDSYVIDGNDPDLQELDAILLNLVLPEMDPAAYADVVEDVQTRFRPRQIIANHLIGCDWTVTPDQLRREVEERGLARVVIPKTPHQAVEIA